MTAGRLSICYAAPGHRFVPTAGTTRNMVSLAAALNEFADVTLAFRQVPAGGSGRPRVLAIDPHWRDDREAIDDVALRGLNPLGHLAYLRTLTTFARKHASSFDVVLEKGSRLSGSLLAAFRRHGVPGVLVENDPRWWSEPLRGARMLAKYAGHLLASAVARRHRGSATIIAETEALKAMLVSRGADARRVEVIGLGVDHALFRPLDQGAARRALGIDPAVTAFIYVGGLDGYHDLIPAIQAWPRGDARLELHVVGDGGRRNECEAAARRVEAPVRFHGIVPHAKVPLYIAAADAGIAAYREDAFPGQIVPFSTLKIPEYMSCARPVVGNPAGQALALLEPGTSAFIFPNRVSAWAAFFADLPSRDRLAEMGRAAVRAARSLSWTATAARYLEVCERVAPARRASGVSLDAAAARLRRGLAP